MYLLHFELFSLSDQFLKVQTFSEIPTKLIKIETSYDLNYFIRFASSTGPALWGGHKLDNCFFKKDQELNFKYNYIFS